MFLMNTPSLVFSITQMNKREIRKEKEGKEGRRRRNGTHRMYFISLKYYLSVYILFSPLFLLAIGHNSDITILECPLNSMERI